MKFWQLSSKGRIIRAIAALMLCCTLMIGATYAWFSDSASTGINTVTAGNLDVELTYQDPDNPLLWPDATDRNLFGEDTMTNWEPGMVVKSDVFRVENKGSLYLKYCLTLEVAEETLTSTNKSLSKVIKMAVLNSNDVKNISEMITDKKNKDEERAAYVRYVNENKNGFMSIADFSETDVLAPVSPGVNGVTLGQMMVLYWEPNEFEVDNQYNNKGGSITFGLHVNATQAPDEQDSFGKYYDDNIEFTKSQAKLDEEAYKEGNFFRTGEGKDAKYSKTKDPFLAAKTDGTPLVFAGDIDATSDKTTFSYGTVSGATGYGNSINFDLNGHNLKASNFMVEYVSAGSGGTFGMKNGKLDMNMTTSQLKFTNMTNIQLRDLEISRPENASKDVFNYHYDQTNEEYENVVSLKNVKISGGRSQIYVGDSDKIELEGCVFTNPKDNSSWGALYLSGGQDATTVIKNTKIDGYTNFIHTANTTITGCTFTKNVQVSDNVSNKPKMTLTVKDTTFEEGITGNRITGGHVALTMEDVIYKGTERPSEWLFDMTIVSGTYSFDPTQYIADGSRVTNNSDGTWTVTKNS